MAELIVKSRDGKEVGKRTLSPNFGTVRISMTSLHRVVVAEEANKRQGTQKTKTRSEVRGGGRKPYKQKKTGNARQGTIRAPHYAHGGMALALTPRDYEKKVNKKERRASILGVLGAQAEVGNVTIIDSLVFDAPRTKDATAFLKNLGLEGARRILIILPQYDEATYKSFRNLQNVEVRTAPTVDQSEKSQAFSARDLMVAKNIIIVQAALDRIEEVWAK
jgi:large subunit ribosomal protein L4